MQFAVYLNGDVSGLILLEDTQLLGPCMLKWSIATLSVRAAICRMLCWAQSQCLSCFLLQSTNTWLLNCIEMQLTNMENRVLEDALLGDAPVSELLLAAERDLQPPRCLCHAASLSLMHQRTTSTVIPPHQYKSFTKTRRKSNATQCYMRCLNASIQIYICPSANPRSALSAQKFICSLLANYFVVDILHLTILLIWPFISQLVPISQVFYFLDVIKLWNFFIHHHNQLDPPF